MRGLLFSYGEPFFGLNLLTKFSAGAYECFQGKMFYDSFSDPSVTATLVSQDHVITILPHCARLFIDTEFISTVFTINSLK